MGLCLWISAPQLLERSLSLRRPDRASGDDTIGAPQTRRHSHRQLQAHVGRFNNWVSERLRDRASVWKQERLYREEQKHLRRGKGDYGADSDDAGKGKSKGHGAGRNKKKTRGGAAASAAAAP